MKNKQVYVSDYNNHRVMKWNKGTLLWLEDEEKGGALTQLSCPHGLFVNTSGAIDVAEAWNDPVKCS